MPEPRCDDWGCPGAASCALHLGRLRQYAAGNPMASWVTRDYHRPPDADSCPDYRRDRPRQWLLSADALDGLSHARSEATNAA